MYSDMFILSGDVYRSSFIPCTTSDVSPEGPSCTANERNPLNLGNHFIQLPPPAICSIKLHYKDCDYRLGS